MRETELRVERAGLLEKYPIPNNAKRLVLINSFPDPEPNNIDNVLGDPANLLLAGNRTIYVSDVEKNSIQVFDTSGTLRERIGRFGRGAGEFDQPLYLAELPDGSLAVYDAGNSRIQLLNSRGALINSFKLFKPCYSMGTDRSGLIYLSFYDENIQAPLINVFNQSGQELASMGSRLEAAHPAFNMTDISIVNDDIYVAWKTYPLIRKYSKSGRLIFEHNLDYGPLKVFGDANRHAHIEGRTVKLRTIISKIRAFSDRYYVLVTYPRLEILKLDLSGNIKSTYWSETPFNFIAYDFALESANNKERLYLLVGSPHRSVSVYDLEK